MVQTISLLSSSFPLKLCSWAYTAVVVMGIADSIIKVHPFHPRPDHLTPEMHYHALCLWEGIKFNLIFAKLTRCIVPVVKTAVEVRIRIPKTSTYFSYHYIQAPD